MFNWLKKVSQTDINELNTIIDSCIINLNSIFSEKTGKQIDESITHAIFFNNTNNNLSIFETTEKVLKTLSEFLIIFKDISLNNQTKYLTNTNEIKTYGRLTIEQIENCLINCKKNNKDIFIQLKKDYKTFFQKLELLPKYLPYTGKYKEYIIIKENILLIRKEIFNFKEPFKKFLSNIQLQEENILKIIKDSEINPSYRPNNYLREIAMFKWGTLSEANLLDSSIYFNGRKVLDGLEEIIPKDYNIIIKEYEESLKRFDELIKKIDNNINERKNLSYPITNYSYDNMQENILNLVKKRYAILLDKLTYISYFIKAYEQNNQTQIYNAYRQLDTIKARYTYGNSLTTYKDFSGFINRKITAYVGVATAKQDTKTGLWADQNFNLIDTKNIPAEEYAERLAKIILTEGYKPSIRNPEVFIEGISGFKNVFFYTEKHTRYGGHVALICFDVSDYCIFTKPSNTGEAEYWLMTPKNISKEKLVLLIQDVEHIKKHDDKEYILKMIKKLKILKVPFKIEKW